MALLFEDLLCTRPTQGVNLTLHLVNLSHGRFRLSHACLQTLLKQTRRFHRYRSRCFHLRRRCFPLRLSRGPGNSAAFLLCLQRPLRLGRNNRCLALSIRKGRQLLAELTRHHAVFRLELRVLLAQAFECLRQWRTQASTQTRSLTRSGQPMRALAHLRARARVGLSFRRKGRCRFGARAGCFGALPI